MTHELSRPVGTLRTISIWTAGDGELKLYRLLPESPRVAVDGACRLNYDKTLGHVIMSINSLSSTANRALRGVSRAVREVEQVATDVAGAVGAQSSDISSEVISVVTRLPELKRQAVANANVLETSEQLLRQLHFRPRR